MGRNLEDRARQRQGTLTENVTRLRMLTADDYSLLSDLVSVSPGALRGFEPRPCVGTVQSGQVRSQHPLPGKASMPLALSSRTPEHSLQVPSVM